MSVGKKILLGIAGTALVFLLFSTAVDVSVVRVVGTPEPIKHTLSDSGIYNSIISSSLDQAKQISGNAGEEIPLSDPAVRSAAESIFDGPYLQSTTNNVIDSVYRWLNGQTPVPDFKIDLTAKKAALADSVAKAAEQKAAALPRCASPPSAASFDAFSATCLPVSVTPEQVASTVKNDIMTGQGFLENPVITADTIKAQGSNKSLFADQLKVAPQAYHKFKATPFILAALTLLALLGVIFFSSSWQRGLRHAGFVLLAVGVFLIIFGLAVNTTVNNKVIPKISLENRVLQTDIRRLVHDSVHQIDTSFLLLGGIYTALGAVAIGGYYLMQKRHPTIEAPEEPAEPEATKLASAKPDRAPPKPKANPSTPKKIKIN